MNKNLGVYKIISVFLVIAVSLFYVNQAKADIVSFLILTIQMASGPLGVALGVESLVLTGVALVVVQAITIIDYYTCWINILWGGCNGGGGGGGGGRRGGDGIQVDVKVNDSDGPVNFLVPASYILKWSATNVEKCISTWAEGEIGPGGTIQYSNVSVIGSIDYTLTCSGVSDTVIVNITGIFPDCAFTADPTTIVFPGKSTLSWSCSNTDSCSIDQNIGDVSPISGSREVTPTEPTTYTLFCNGPGGARSWPTTVNVLNPKIKEIIPR